MKIYTRTGDEGETGLYGGGRVRKDAPRTECCGTIDELNAALGLVQTEPLPETIAQVLYRIQNELFIVGAELAAAEPNSLPLQRIGPKHIAALEEAIDRHEAQLTRLRGFILPGGTRQAAVLHLARAICRRAERRLVTLAHSDSPPISESLLVYVNRLSDMLFVFARAVNAAAGQGDTAWQKEP